MMMRIFSIQYRINSYCYRHCYNNSNSYSYSNSNSYSYSYSYSYNSPGSLKVVIALITPSDSNDAIIVPPVSSGLTNSNI